MTLMDAQPPQPRRGIRRYLPLPIIILLVVLIAVLLGYRFWNVREEHAVARFLTALQHSNYEEAYRLWQPSPTYSYGEFLMGWGERGDYGKIREFRILRSESKGRYTVIVTVRINNVDPPLDLLVDRRTKGLSYSVF